MSDTVDTETMKVSGAADTLSSPKDNNIAPKCEVTDPTPSAKDEQGGNKRDGQVKKFILKGSGFLLVTTLEWQTKEICLQKKRWKNAELPCYPLLANNMRHLLK